VVYSVVWENKKSNLPLYPHDIQYHSTELVQHLVKQKCCKCGKTGVVV